MAAAPAASASSASPTAAARSARCVFGKVTLSGLVPFGSPPVPRLPPPRQAALPGRSAPDRPRLPAPSAVVPGAVAPDVEEPGVAASTSGPGRSLVRPWLGGARLGFAVYAVGQVLLIALLYVGYGLSRRLALGREVEALGNAVDVWRLERFLWLPDEAALQNVLLAHEWALRGANWYYISVHFPAAVLLLVWVFGRHRTHWSRVRNVIIFATGAGLVIHLLYPLAPPRFLPEASPSVRLVDTGAVLGPSPYGEATGGVANQYAAMPSLHVGWAVLEAWAVVTILRHRARWLVLLHPVATVAVVVVTANHYWLDGLVGGLLVTGAVAVAGRRPRAATPGAAVPGKELGAEPYCSIC